MKTSVIVIIIIILVVAGWFLFSSEGQDQNMENQEPDETTQPINMLDETPKFSLTPSDQVPVTTGDVVILETNFGDVRVQLNREAAPQTTDNFAKLASEGFYDGLLFHRVIPGFVAQGGDPSGDGTGGPGYTLPAEIGLDHVRGAVAMARLGDQVNPERQSSGSQFYVALQDLPQLDGQYTVFAEVISGMEFIDQIATAETNQLDKPVADVIIERAYIEEK